MQTAAPMQTARRASPHQESSHEREPGPDARSTELELRRAVCDEVAELVLEVRAALREARYEDLRQMAHPRALRAEQTRLVRRFGGDAADFWSTVSTHVEAVRVVREGVAEAYEEVRHRRTGASLRLVCTVEYVQGRWRITDAREAVDERFTVVLLRGSPPEQRIDAARWTREWTEEHGPTARLSVEGMRGLVEHVDAPYRATLRTASGHDLSRALGLTGSMAELLDKQPSATIVSLVPTLDARTRTEQLRWLSWVVAALGANDAANVWVPSAAKAIPFPAWRSATQGPLALNALAALWLRTQRQRGAWVTRGLTSFMLPEIEVHCAGLSVATVRALLREAARRLLAHHEARETRKLGATAPAVPAIAPQLYRRTKKGPLVLPVERLETSLDLGDSFVAGEVEAVVAQGRQGPRPGESYGRWGAIALESEPAWWATAA